MKFTHLHVHSHYSLLDGLTKIDDLLNYTKDLGMDSLAITDHGVLYGAMEFYQKAKAMGIKPIIGCEIYLAQKDMLEKRTNVDNKKYHLVLLAKDKKGYKNLVKIVTQAHLKGFYYKPRADMDLLRKYSEGLIALTACIQGKIPQLIIANQLEEARKSALEFQEIFGKENFYLELQHHPTIPQQDVVNKELIKMSKELDIPLVATNDTHYLRKEDAKAQDILMRINTNSDPSNPNGISLIGEDFSLKSPKEMIEDFKNVRQAIENTQKIAQMCNLEFNLGKTRLPKFPLPQGKTDNQYLRELCYKGLEKRYPKKNAQVEERLEYELSVIEKTGFASYFLIVQDFVNWAKEQRIVVGPGRGSAAGSLVAYLLRITNIDPLKYDLLFQRFLNPERVSMPDIDLDFADRRRDEVIEYVAQKYGRKNVAQIITFGTMAARAAIRDVGRALGYEYSYCDKVAKMIPFGFSLNETIKKIKEFKELYESEEKAQQLIDLALKLEGCARHASTHACGVVISDTPLDKIVPLQHPSQDGNSIVTQYEMHSVEAMGLLKMDFLGLKNLTIIEDTLARIYAIYKKKVDIESIPLDDRKTFKLLQKGDCIGVFQLESDGMRRYLKQLKPTCFEDIVAMVALYRPGPMGHIPEYIACKNKDKRVEYLHPKLKPILKNTYSIPVYQEQIMRIAQDLAGFTLSEADVLRKAIGKKIEELLMAQKEKFVEGMAKNDIKKDIALKIWHWIEPFARYSFNKSHATCYGAIAYQTAYLKANYPIEYMAALLTSEKGDLEKISLLIDECKKMGIEVLPPEINESFSNFSVVPQKSQIRFGLSAIKNVGENVVFEIIDERKENGKFKSIDDFIARMNSKVLNKKSMESLIKSGCFDSLGERNQLLESLNDLLEWARGQQKIKDSGQTGLFDSSSSFSKSVSISLKESKPAGEKEMLDWEKELLGLYVSSHPLKKYASLLRDMTVSIKKIKNDTGEESYTPQCYYTGGFNPRISESAMVKIGGVISSIKKILTKKGDLMMFVKVEDLNDKIEAVVFPSLVERKKSLIVENKIVLVTGRVDTKDGVPKIIASDIEEIVEMP